MNEKATEYVVCVKNDAYPAALERGKIYRTLPDSASAKRKLIRILDESGEDYLYPDAFFLPIKLTAEIEEALSY